MQRTGWLRAGLALTGMMTLAACGHRDAVDTVGDWYHQYQGGEIAKQRPPAPGVHDPYPHVGLTPTQSVDLPSAQARQALTDRLTLQRNLGQRLAVADGPLDTAPTTPPPTPRSRPANDENGSSMSVSAAGQPASATPSSAPATPSGKTANNAPARPADPPEAALPDVTRFAPPPIRPGELPQIGALPPVAPQFPGFAIPRDAAIADSVTPSYDLTEPHGTLIRFGQASDQMLKGQEGTIGAALRGRGPSDLVYVKGFGEITSFRPSEQALGINLGLLRTRVVAMSLILRGVPAANIRISAGALGRGARIDLTPY